MKELPLILSDVCLSLVTEWSDPTWSRGGQAAERSGFCSSGLIFIPTTNNVPTELRQRRAELLLPNKPRSELKKKQPKNKNHSSLWCRVNKPSVGGGHRTHEPKFNFQSAESKTSHQSRSPTDDKKDRNHQNCLGNVSYHFIVFLNLFSS